MQPGPWVVTMGQKQRRITTREFKDRCLTLLDEVAATGVGFVVTRDGKPLVRVVPSGKADRRPSLRDRVLRDSVLRDSVVHEGDIVSPIDVW